MKEGSVPRFANHHADTEIQTPPVGLRSAGRSVACAPGSSCNPNRDVVPVRFHNSTNYDHSASARGLGFLWLELTSKCNLQCVHCYAESGPDAPLTQQMTYSDWLLTLKEAAEIGCKNVQFIGGEPTMYPQLPELIAEARLLKYDFVEVFTNGTAFTDRIKHALLSCKVNIAFSIYSATATTHDSITLRSGSFERTKTNIQWALEHGLKVRAAIIKMNQSMSEIDETLALLEHLGVKEIQVDRLRAVGRGASGKQTASPVEELCGRCWDGKLCVTAEGKVFPCIFARHQQVGTVRNGVKNIIEGKPLLDFRSGLQAPANP